MTSPEPQTVWLLFQDSGEYGVPPELAAVYSTEEAATAAVAAKPEDERRDWIVSPEQVLTGQEP